ncbi:MAG: right-handed parallel beta-helix repeat-containing protein, partial [Planctomycetes bacterium]|nr:right-handed parallel beta-helix repeat-containing protein [Planctomycetota bacterium]
MRGVATFVSLLLVGGCAVKPRLQPQEIVLDRDDIVIDRDTVVRPGHYGVRDANGDGVLHVVADGVTLTLAGVTLDGAAGGGMPDAFEGIGVSVANHERVVITGGAVKGFRVGVRAANANALRLEGVDVSNNRAMRLRSTPQREDPADWLWPHENDKGEWETRYGAGISLVGCDDAVVKHCCARTTQNGLLLTRCRNALVEENDFSFLSGWGVAMYRSTHCDIVRNRCDFCVRGYSHGVYARGQDSAAILMFEQCSNNLIEGNSGTHSGDGLFLYAGHETTQRTGRGGSNENKVVHNDFSHAVANGIEATFSRGNVFLANILDGCDHGVWAGYSYETEIRGNTIRDCANGISIEHGHDNVIEGNTIERCRLGVHLWWDDDKDLLASVYGQRNDTSSSRNVVVGNRMVGGTTPIRLDRDTESRVQQNGADILVAQDAAGPAAFHPSMPRGREHIVIGEWGPLDPRHPALV